MQAHLNPPATGRTFKRTLNLLGIYRTVLGLVMGNIQQCSAPKTGVLCIKATKDGLVLYYCLCEMQVTTLLQLILANMVVQMTAVCLITLKWEKPLRLGPYQYLSQTVFWDAAYLLFPISWQVMKSLCLNPGCCLPIQGRILKRSKLYSIIVCLAQGE